MNYFITAIGTDSGKTLFSAIMTEALNADYWKPIQAGEPRDTAAVQALISNDKSRFHKEAYFLKTPASPHAAARIDSIEIALDSINPPATSNNLIIEGAGGVLVPINDNDFVLDLIPNMKAEVIVVANLYLGSINHTLLTLNLLRERGYAVKGIVFNGPENVESETIILKHFPYKCLLKIKQEEKINRTIVRKYADDFLKNWNE